MHQSVYYLRLRNSRQQFLQVRYMHTFTLNSIKIANGSHADRIIVRSVSRKGANVNAAESRDRERGRNIYLVKLSEVNCPA